MLQHQKKSGKNNANFGQHHITQGPSKFCFTIPYLFAYVYCLQWHQIHKLLGLV